jgi:tetratricopeptide (TPR) repeat protein
MALAASYADTALLLSYELKSTANIAAALLLKARIDAAKGNWLSAVEKCEQVISILKERNQPYQTARAYYYYGMALREKKGTDTGNRYLLQAKDIFTKIGALGWLKKCAAIP